jgi:hypothetical protein
VSEDNALKEIKRMLEKHLEYPVDFLPETQQVSAE